MGKLTKSRRRQIRELFSLYDEDSSGTISMEELPTLLRGAGFLPTQSRCGELMERYDKNGDGTLSLNELYRLCENEDLPEFDKETIKSAFDKVDKDKKGFLRVKDLTRLLTTMGETLSEEDAKNLFQSADTSEDGKVDLNELMALLGCPEEQEEEGEEEEGEEEEGEEEEEYEFENDDGDSPYDQDGEVAAVWEAYKRDEKGEEVMYTKQVTAALNSLGIFLTKRQVRSKIQEYDEDSSMNINFDEFCNIVKELREEEEEEEEENEEEEEAEEEEEPPQESHQPQSQHQQQATHQPPPPTEHQQQQASHQPPPHTEHQQEATHQPPPHTEHQQQQASHQPPPQVPQTNCFDKAVFIGICYPGTEAALKGCVNDVRSVQRLLEHYQFTIKEKKVLVDDPKFPGRDGPPTAKNIKAAFQWLGSKAQRGQSLLLSYSGHGSQTACKVAGSEEDDMDEALVPGDYKTAGLIIDDDIKKWCVDPLPEGCRLCALFDCCHSGTIMDLPYTFRKTGKNWELAPCKAAKPLACDVVMVSGCMDKQTSADLQGATPGGALTGALIAAIVDQPQRGLFACVSAVQKALKSDEMTQIPQVCSSKPLDVNTPTTFFADRLVLPAKTKGVKLGK